MFFDKPFCAFHFYCRLRYVVHLTALYPFVTWRRVCVGRLTAAIEELYVRVAATRQSPFIRYSAAKAAVAREWRGSTITILVDNLLWQ